MAGWIELPWWRRLLLLPLAMMVFPLGLAVMLAILLAVAVWNMTVWCCYWVRFRLTGAPIPAKYPIADSVSPDHGDQ